MSLNALIPESINQAVERALLAGDLSRLTPDQRLAYYTQLCESLNLNPLSKPFDYIVLNNKLTLYATRNCTDQLRQRDGISIQIVSREQSGDCYVVTARATTPAGRSDESIGAVGIKNLSGDALCNAMMKAESKAKRRVTLSLCGLSLPDETEIETIPHAQPAQITDQSPEDIFIENKSQGLDQWQCGKRRAMELLNICRWLATQGITESEMKTRLPDGKQSRRDLTAEEADLVIADFKAWADVLRAKERAMHAA